MRILGLDLGTKTGWATNAGGTLQAGIWNLATPQEIREWGKQRITRRRDPRVARLAQKLESFCDNVDLVIFEDVQFTSYTLAVQLWSSLRAALWLMCGGGAKPVMECVPVGTLKLFATGCGNATKGRMLHAAKRSPYFVNLPLQQLDDNAIDALFLFQWGLIKLSRMKI